MPVFDESLEVYGFTARRLDEQKGPKTLSFLENSRGSWYPCSTSRKLIIVEDQLSAIRASKYVNAVALLGTDITDALLDILRDIDYTDVVLALDKDAYRKALKTAARLRNKLKMRVLKLHVDLKDLPEDRLKAMFDLENLYHTPAVNTAPETEDTNLKERAP